MLGQSLVFTHDCFVFLPQGKIWGGRQKGRARGVAVHGAMSGEGAAHATHRQRAGTVATEPHPSGTTLPITARGPELVNARKPACTTTTVFFRIGNRFMADTGRPSLLRKQALAVSSFGVFVSFSAQLWQWPSPSKMTLHRPLSRQRLNAAQGAAS